MDKLTTAYVRECLAMERYKNSHDPLTLEEVRERQIEVNMGGWYIRILELSSVSEPQNRAYYTHMVDRVGKGGVYDHNTTLACLVRRINKVCATKGATCDR